MAIRRCPYCKAIIDESQKYCNNCGTQLLFPTDDQDEEPIKGEKIVDEDFKEISADEDDEPDNRLMAKEEADLQEIDLEEVLEGSGHFPDGAKPKTSRVAPPTPPIESEPPAKSSRRGASRAAKKPTPAKIKPDAKQDTKEEIDKLIAVLEEKERKKTGAVDDAGEPAFPPEPAGLRPVKEPVELGSAWAELLSKPATSKFDTGEIAIPRVPDTAPEEDGYGSGHRLDKPLREEAEEGEDEDKIFAPPASFVPGDTMDFQNEVLARTPLGMPVPSTLTPTPPPEPTRMGIPERITREEIFKDRDENETPPETIFGEMKLRPAEASPATAELDKEEPAPRRRLGFFRKTAALLFDVAFIGAVWALTLWLAAKLLGIALPDLIEASPVASGVLLAALLGSYLFLFLFFLGETLGDRMASRKS
ncbi:MAG: zinc ribbon domain-containing protein [Candidatus Aminicenantes bacterium]|nr:zinc ribbon domain-containing protein [Candidatus Aminicenantes bacterium]